ncbi:hypothetical protein A1F94_001146 [Pyrenophora tritici-repentis]|uniref:Uncharacterized protein n=2 Tax=Pyrenophora tritici-repentis TaxID=45151 RepID=A0A2W1FDG2_9PLEO|nr:uncharacterized protein PTRG_01437 [Pyrenophora tritici-repentis Pt-1C-BFP]KAF7577631.1 hypothetical protein PtrM4_018710 [Pyrenophora tritici-repentis]EDU40875.1 hypothetical protein PTRG_01437 [Pyrenophora tritici-repentis Pt-1C-BFP]KAG9388254.1 hypothetical protein A1F94_001146 [Pyrenophora tritici-repentis]KAI1530092.1 hypothetical protein PtrSN001C_008780 [Pyrenophora tritici-repentis]KAI1563998.1 hypothetical protein PtrEW4_009086 [Pyrenophora tritici-repentis]
MRGHTLFLAAYLVLPTITAPVLPSNISPVFPTADRRNAFPVTSAISNILERTSMVEKVARSIRVRPGGRDVEPTEEKAERSIRVRPGGRDVESTEENVERSIRVRPGGRNVESTEDHIERSIRVRPGGRDVEPAEEKVERSIRVRPGGRRDVDLTEENVNVANRNHCGGDPSGEISR